MKTLLLILTNEYFLGFVAILALKGVFSWHGGHSPAPIGSYPPHHAVHRAYRTAAQTAEMNAFGKQTNEYGDYRGK